MNTFLVAKRFVLFLLSAAMLGLTTGASAQATPGASPEAQADAWRGGPSRTFSAGTAGGHANSALASRCDLVPDFVLKRVDVVLNESGATAGSADPNCLPSPFSGSGRSFDLPRTGGRP